MKTELKKSVRVAAVLVSVGLAVSFFIFFLLFGKGLQLFMPLILFSLFFIVFIILGKNPFVARHPIIKIIIAAGFTALMMILI